MDDISHLILKLDGLTPTPFPSSEFFSVDHENLATVYQKDECFSVILCLERLATEHLNDPQYCITHNEIAGTEMEEKASRLLPINFDYERLIKKLKLPQKAGNAATSDEDNKYNGELLDAVVHALLLRKMIRAYLQEMIDASYDENGKKLKGKNLIQSKRARRKELFKTRVWTRGTRVFPLPDPLSYWDDRHSYQQWFFARHLKTLFYAIGGYGGSSWRENHGRFAHVFATLESRGIRVPTAAAMLDKHNRLKPLQSWGSFRVIRSDLTGNYGADWSKTKALFSGRLLSFNWEKDDKPPSLEEIASREEEE